MSDQTVIASCKCCTKEIPVSNRDDAWRVNTWSIDWDKGDEMTGLEEAYYCSTDCLFKSLSQWLNDDDADSAKELIMTSRACVAFHNYEDEVYTRLTPLSSPTKRSKTPS